MSRVPVNLNLIVDISSIRIYYASNYKAIKHVLFTYVTVLLSRSAVTYKDFSPYVVEDPTYDSLWYNLMNGSIGEEAAMIEAFGMSNFPTQMLSRVIDDLQDHLSTHIKTLVNSVNVNRSLYMRRSVMLNINLINQHTLIVSFKTVSDDNDAPTFQHHGHIKQPIYCPS